MISKRIKSSQKFILGISGFIGSGKSTVARIFEKYGALWIDADEVVKELYEPGAEGYEKIKSFFGEEYLTKDKKLNRKKLAKIVFKNPQKLKILHALIHPMVTSEIQKKIDKCQKSFIVLEATYFEKNYLRQCISSLLWIETAKNKTHERIATTRSLPAELFNKIYNLQIKPENIDYVIENNGSKKDLEIKIKEFMKNFSFYIKGKLSIVE